MEQRLSLITLAVSDLPATRRFYVDGLGWAPSVEAPGVLMLRAGAHLLLSLWDRGEFEAEVGPIMTGDGVAPLTLAHNVATRQQVDAVLDQARDAGATAIQPAERREWGGYSGYFADPDGFRWEIACAPGEVNDIVLP
ncbi:VOC family protein [Nesterenkonia sp. LB17]|uniref:VOC family protein n=1 Tax=unclassified Nesterenkonia TaxID=2629769 RepID=UPI001F4CC7B0|nr:MULTISPECIES: VOC family protein [unclassified Nesterenkonia]MCH8559833.1 VOC family protein [Nesterenkonia sp. DZ6]MCH8561997.1 VOC family protein [Nesterenkonia sp. YGD6]MCH8564466.1 VOC family protein [Nesterenkonia sp. LB17]MCH8570092.1 VOC family protein [Nesterenkonia sp. AY15]